MTENSRKCAEISADEEARIVAAFDDWTASGDVIALRTRALAYLLWDGGMRTQAAIDLDLADVCMGMCRVQKKFQVGNRTVVIGSRASRSISAYLAAVFGKNGPALPYDGPLFSSSKNSKTRMSKRTAIHCWHEFLETPPGKLAYQLDDLVFTGRLKFLRQVGGNTAALAAHAGVTLAWAGQYARHLREQPPPARTVLKLMGH